MVSGDDFEYCRSLAVTRLNQAVDEELSAGDRLIIKNIAVTAFKNAADDLCKKGVNIANCAQTYKNEWAINQLRQYGFQIRRIGQFLDIDLR